MIWEVEIEGRTHRVSVERAEGGWTVTVDDGPPRRIDGRRLGSAEWLLRDGERSGLVGAWVDGDQVSLQLGGHSLRAVVEDPRRKALAQAGGGSEGVVVTPMPGVVNRILVDVGQQVQKGDVLLVVEAMKMENEYRCPCDGVVRIVHVTPGTAVEANTTLITVEPA